MNSDIIITEASEIIIDDQVEEHLTTADNIQPLVDDTNSIASEQDGDSLQDQSKRILSRIIMCMFSLCFLWLTSFQLCYYIANISIPAPAMQSVVDHCSFLYHKVSENKQQYERCIERQMKSCNEALDNQHKEELSRVTQLSAINQRLLQDFQTRQVNCSSSLTFLKHLIVNWKKGGRQYTLDYTDSCSSNQNMQSDIQTWLNDGSMTTSSQNQILDLVQSMTSLNTLLVSDLVDYSTQLNDYNTEYVHNKTADLHIQSVHLVDNFTTEIQNFVNQTIIDISSKLMQQFQSCLLSDSIQCPFGTDLLNIYNDIVFDVEVNHRMMLKTADNLKGMLEEYIAEVQTAMKAADDFYDSVNGARGIIKYIVNTFKVVGSTSSLCGKSTPNWCNFDPVSKHK